MSTPTAAALTPTVRTRKTTTTASYPMKNRLAIAGATVITRSSGSLTTYRAPSAISARTLRFVVGSGSSSRVLMLARASSETT